MATEQVNATSDIAPDDGSDVGSFWRHAFESLVETLPEPAFVVDGDGYVTHWNDGVEALTGYPAADAVGEHAFDLFGTKGQDETLAEEVVRTGEPIRETAIRSAESADGNVFHGRALGVPITTPAGESVGAVEIITRLTDLVEQREKVHELQQKLSGEVEVAVDELRDSSTEVSENAQEISDFAQEQTDNLGEIQSEVGTFSATVEQIASSAEEVSSQSSEAKTLAEESADAAEETLDAVEEVADQASGVADDARSLEDRVDEIDQIVDVINDIADQTNLLALNANIEAARADQSGDGFAVVANEIKDLAEQSKQRVDEIESIVAEVRETALGTVDSVESQTDRIDSVAADIETVVDNQQSI